MSSRAVHRARGGVTSLRDATGSYGAGGSGDQQVQPVKTSVANEASSELGRWLRREKALQHLPQGLSLAFSPQRQIWCEPSLSVDHRQELLNLFPAPCSIRSRRGRCQHEQS